MSLSENALRLWTSFFLTPGSTLRFGGDHAEFEITPMARDALDELVVFGAVTEIDPDDQWPGREHYGATELDLRDECRSRGLNPFDDYGPFITFRKKTTNP